MSEQVGTAAAAPETGAPAPGPVTTPEPSKAKAIGKSIGKRIIGAVVVFAVLGLGGLAYRYFSGDVSIAKVGDCITATVKADASDAKVVGCDKAEAKNKVVGIVPDVTSADFSNEAKAQEICNAYPTWENVIWYGKEGGNGDAWCLEPIAK